MQTDINPGVDVGPEDNLSVRVDRVIAKLRERGQRLTPQRLAIIRGFVSRTDHPSAESLYLELRGQFPIMAISTVYNTLHALVEMGEAVELSPAAQEARFDPNTGNHGHLVCLGCRTVLDFPMEHTPTIPGDTAGGFDALLHVHQVYGYCASCRGEDARN